MPSSEIVAPRLRSSLPAADYQGFFRAVRDAMNLHMQYEAVPPEWNIRITEDYPQDREGQFDTSFDVILFHVENVTKAGLARDGVARIPRGIGRIEVAPHPEKGRYSLVTDGWYENVLVQFEVLAKTNARANEIALWFHRFLMLYAHRVKYFVARGIENFDFTERLADRKTEDFGQVLYSRRLQYQFRLQFLLTYDSKDLESIHLELKTSDESPVSEYNWRVNDGQVSRE